MQFFKSTLGLLIICRSPATTSGKASFESSADGFRETTSGAINNITIASRDDGKQKLLKTCIIITFIR